MKRLSDCPVQRLADCRAKQPVPPAGDVELPPRKHEMDGWPYSWNACHDAFTPIVTRLTAERDGLLAEVKNLQALVNQDLQQLEQMNSELTKARELLKSVRGYVNRCAIEGGRSDRIKLRAVDDFLTQQPANPIVHNVDERIDK